jgi:hypothetical protein
VCEKRMLRRIFESKREKVAGGVGRQYNMYASPNIQEV